MRRCAADANWLKADEAGEEEVVCFLVTSTTPLQHVTLGLRFQTAMYLELAM